MSNSPTKDPSPTRTSPPSIGALDLHCGGSTALAVDALTEKTYNNLEPASSAVAASQSPFSTWIPPIRSPLLEEDQQQEDPTTTTPQAGHGIKQGDEGMIHGRSQPASPHSRLSPENSALSTRSAFHVWCAPSSTHNPTHTASSASPQTPIGRYGASFQDAEPPPLFLGHVSATSLVATSSTGNAPTLSHTAPTQKQPLVTSSLALASPKLPVDRGVRPSSSSSPPPRRVIPPSDQSRPSSRRRFDLVLQPPSGSQIVIPVKLQSGEQDEVNISRNETLLSLADMHVAQIGDSLGELCNLQGMWLGYNPIYSLPDTFGQLSGLQHLYLDNTQLSKLPDSFSQLVALRQLYLNNTQISSLPQSLSRLTSLNVLSLNGCGFSMVPDCLVSGSLVHLKELWIGKNKISALPESIGNALPQLQLLAANDNLLSTLPSSIGNLSRLEELWLDHNQLTSLPVASLCRLSRLLFLSVNGNMLSNDSLPDSLLFRLPSLYKLDFGHNLLTLPPFSLNADGRLQMTKLEILNLEANRLHGALIAEHISSLSHSIPNLRELNLRGNQITSLPDSLGSLTSLRRLNLEDNLLNSLPDSIGRLTGLYQLYLESNELEQLPAALSQLNGLYELHLGQNHFQGLPLWICTHLLQLRELSLEYNQLSSIPAQIANLSRLRKLSIAGNNLVPNTRFFGDNPHCLYVRPPYQNNGTSDSDEDSLVGL